MTKPKKRHLTRDGSMCHERLPKNIDDLCAKQWIYVNILTCSPTKSFVSYQITCTVASFKHLGFETHRLYEVGNSPFSAASSSESEIVNDSAGTVFFVVTLPKFSFVCLSSVDKNSMKSLVS